MNIQLKKDRSRVTHIALWVLQVLTAAAFLMAGLAKMSGQPMMVETFEKVVDPPPDAGRRGAAGLHDDRGGLGARADTRWLAGGGPGPGLLCSAHSVGAVRYGESLVCLRAGRAHAGGGSHDAIGWAVRTLVNFTPLIVQPLWRQT